MKAWVGCGLAIAAAAVLSAGAGCEGGGTLSGSGGGGGGVILGTAGSGLATGSGGAPTCNCCEREVRTTKLYAEILIVLDTSATMNDTLDGSNSKWAAATAGINAAVDAAPVAVNWGLAFLASADDACGTGDRLPEGSTYSIRPALAYRSDGDMLAKGGNRPTRAALNLAAAYLSGRDRGRSQIIALITDGMPECRPGAADVFASDAEGTLRAVTAAADNWIMTSVIGLGTAGGPADATLSQMATLGGLPRPASPAYVPASSTSDIATALSDLVTQFADCTFAVPPPPTDDGTSDRFHIRVRVDGQVIPQDPVNVNGWSYTDSTAQGIRLYGPACDAVRGVPAPAVSIIFFCYGGA